MSSSDSVRFTDLGLAPEILKAVDYEQPSAIQAESIPPLLAGSDLLGQAQTGTGKTAAFALPLLSRLDTSSPLPQVLVLTPTRELAIQVAEAMQAYARHLTNFHVLPIYGGQSIGIQLKHLKRNAQVIVGTPGRVIDHLKRGTLKLHSLKTMVLDEADEMLRMGFVDDVETILQETPDAKQLVLFSATMPDAIKRLTRRYLKDPVEIRIKSKTATVDTIRQLYWQGKTFHKLDTLTRILESEPVDGVIIFVRTKSMTHELSEKLEARGYDTVALNGDIKQEQREKTIDQFRQGRFDILIATDVVARGLDVERISHVINYDMPHDTESYIHRIGRTGRAGREGTAILFIPPRGQRLLQSIERATRQKITPFELPSAQDISDHRVQQFQRQVQTVISEQKLDFMQQVLLDMQKDSGLSLEEIAVSLAWLVQKDRPLDKSQLLDIAPQHNRNNEHRDGREDRKSRENRGDRPQRKPREDKPDKRPGKKNSDFDNDADMPPMVRYRVEVGREHGVEAKHIVGAIANEAGVEGEFIRKLRLGDDHATVELPEGMPKAIAKHLFKVQINGYPLQLREDGEAPEDGERSFQKKPKAAKGSKSASGKPKKSKAGKRSANSATRSDKPRRKVKKRKPGAGD